MEKIDFVVTWVDANDPNWQKCKSKYQTNVDEMNEENRYRDFDMFKYWFRAVEKYAPWVNNIYLVTNGQTPTWLNKNNKKLKLINHDEYIPQEDLPTFNSNVIELNLHRINSLSEHFVLFNDDTFINSATQPIDFFENGMPRDYGIYTPIIPHSDFWAIVFNNVRIINKHFQKRSDLKKNWKKFVSVKYGLRQLRTVLSFLWRDIPGYYNSHLPSSLLKSTFKEVWKDEGKELEKVSKHKFRQVDDLSHWLMKYWQIEEGKFMPQSKNFGRVYSMEQTKEITEALQDSKIKTICINDTNDLDLDILEYAEKIKKVLKEKFPEKSSFEL
ncbi:Stealth CR1 domain-containing protein [Pediococcus acidilactici]|uniref:Stealth CR1 domain-containing protein n=1 Tax=Pediococcus acidilactici TaxID=1254 RepID=UPI00132F9362|nr:Stealth CR1 domain-containing protein [Pediococcus acidilactici]KAF0493152.1 capsule biosynthesis protein CapG [Pediococcus acidilactici]MCJ2192752.1 Stealth CR1 domain-containing protein [Pediococcus acidilactici]MWB53001.1 capsule biosynthesis protein CapG [Pediococcus acidilactici]